MTSSYTANNGLEKPDAGDQDGTWGGTLNTNFDIIDRVLSGVGSISLSGTTHTLTTTDGTLTDGMYKVIVLAGSPSGTNTITISPNDQDKLYFVVNSSGQTATFTQGSGSNVSIATGAFDIVYADGAGSGAAVTSLLSKKLSTGAITTSGNIIIPDSGNIGSASDTDAMAISSGGVVAFSAVPTFPNDTIETADIQDNAVTLAKMAGLARGKIIYGDASGDPAALTVGSSNYILKSDGTDIAWAANTASVALDDIGTGDAASTLATSAGNITIDAQGDDTDIILKGTDGGVDTTFLTLDGSEAGKATFNAGIVVPDGGNVGSATTPTAIDILSGGEIGVGAAGSATAQTYVYNNSSDHYVFYGYQAATGTAYPAMYVYTAGDNAAIYGQCDGAHYGIRGYSAGSYGAYFSSAGAGLGRGMYAVGESKYFIGGMSSTTYGGYSNGGYYSSTNVYAGSDSRLKDVTGTITTSSGILAKVNQLKPIMFKWKANTDGYVEDAEPECGFLAQEVGTIFPDLIDEVETPDMSGDEYDNGRSDKTLNEQLGTTYAMTYEKVCVYLTAALQELSAKNDALEARNDSLEARIAALESA